MRRTEQLFLLWQRVIFFNKQLIEFNETRCSKSIYTLPTTKLPILYQQLLLFMDLLIQSTYLRMDLI